MWPSSFLSPGELAQKSVFFVRSVVAQTEKTVCLCIMQETRVRSLGWEDPLEREMATHSSTPTWKIARTEEPGGLESMGSQSDTTERLDLT